MNNAFIIGTGRCGTTYLAQVLNAHSQVCVPPEMQCIFEYDTNGSRFYENIALGAIGDAAVAADLLERCCPHDLARFFNYREYCEGLEYPLRSMQDFFAGYYDAIAKSHNKKILIEQTPWYGQRLDIMTRVFPDAKFIHVVRDGRDVALSFARTPWWFKKAELNLARWANEIKKIAADAAALLSAENYLVVKYENLVADTHAEVLRICNFLGITLESSQLDPAGYIDYDSYCRFDMENLSSTAYLNWKKGKGSSSSFQGSAYAWKKDKVSQFQNVPERIKESLTLFGYDVSDDADDTQQSQSSNYNVKVYLATLEAKVADLCETVAGRELTINDQSVHIRSIESELSIRAQRIAEFEQELTARGQHIAGLASTIDDQIKHITGLDSELSNRAKRLADFEAELKARTQHIAGLNQAIEDLTHSIEDHEADRLAHIRQEADMAVELSARGEHISNLNQLIDDQTKYIAELVTELAMRAEQYAAYEAEVIACAERKAVLEKALVDQAQQVHHLDAELLLCGERLAEYETAAASLKSHLAELNDTVSAQEQRIHNLDAALLDAGDQHTLLQQALRSREDDIAKLDANVNQQAIQISELSADLSRRVDHINELEEEKGVQNAEIRALENNILTQQARIIELTTDALRMKEALDQLNASWCGRLQAFRQKLHK
ncbi:sulfotransferase [Pseudomonas salomonii]|uniref:Sulfotransferase n=1 Tax=Pseudomonas salomonii TaxID=191391 RepID=A0A7Y8KM38_9PSED|nr:MULTISPECIES: sulfotransferase [Pseudomonas]NWF06880.1 sulfotransferase [Pseudomonas salomonii]